MAGGEPLLEIVTTLRVAQSAVVELRGELDVSTAARLPTAVTELLESGVSQVVLDLSGLSFVDSTGLSTLVGLHNELRRRARSLQLIHPQPQALKVMEITGLLQVLDCRTEPDHVVVAQEHLTGSTD